MSWTQVGFFLMCGLTLSLELPPESHHTDMSEACSVIDLKRDEVTDSVLTAF